jgi:hypothetical protein
MLWVVKLSIDSGGAKMMGKVIDFILAGLFELWALSSKGWFFRERKTMKIFISYRRNDSAGYAGRLFDILTKHFGAKNVFMDIDTIAPGKDFRTVIADAVGKCDVMLVLIGKHWLNMVDDQGRRRLDDPHDWVRIEITTAVAKRRVRVIPVLVGNAPMPGDNELPEELEELHWRNAIELSDGRFQHDTKKLIQAIKDAAAKRKPAKQPARGFLWRLATIMIVLLVILGGTLLYFQIYRFPRIGQSLAPQATAEVTDTLVSLAQTPSQSTEIPNTFVVETPVQLPADSITPTLIPAAPFVRITNPMDKGTVSCDNQPPTTFCLFHVEGKITGLSSFSGYSLYVFVFPLIPQGAGWYLQKSPAAINSNGGWEQSPAYLGNTTVHAQKGDTFRIRAALMESSATIQGRRLNELANVQGEIILSDVSSAEIDGIVAISDVTVVELDK